MKVLMLSGLEGLISDEVGLKLAELAGSVPGTEAIVEIGSYKGKSTSFLAAGAIEGNGALVFAVDPWDTPGNAGGRFGFDKRETREAFFRQIKRAGVADQIVARQGFSRKIAATWKLPVGLLYIDGSHIEADVRADWQAWSPHLAPGAVVAFDDYRTERNPGVTRVVNGLIALQDRRWEFEPEPLAIGYAE